MRQKKQKRNNGFTLVELIVVLVILAILAVFLVPALTGYIDKAKDKQLIINAKRCLTAAQAEFSECYADEKTSFGNASISNVTGYGNTVIAGSEEAKTIMKNAEVPDCTWLTVGCNTALAANDKDAYKITFLYYAEGNKSVYFDGESWIIGPYPSKVANQRKIYTVYCDNLDN